MTRKERLALEHITTKEVVISEVGVIAGYLVIALFFLPREVSFWWLLAGCIILLTAFSAIRDRILLMVNERRAEVSSGDDNGGYDDY